MAGFPLVLDTFQNNHAWGEFYCPKSVLVGRFTIFERDIREVNLDFSVAVEIEISNQILPDHVVL